jgi:predicted nucleotidyltransferase
MLQKIRKVLKNEKRIIFAYLFGSALKYPKYSRDVDIAIFVKGKVKPGYELELALKVEREIKKPTEIVLLNDKPPLIISEVLRNCRLIFSRDEKVRVKFETSALREILDLNELMNEFDKMRFERYGVR